MYLIRRRPNNSTTLKIKVPDTITTWVASAFAVSDVVGFGVSTNPAQVPFTVTVKLTVTVTVDNFNIRG